MKLLLFSWRASTRLPTVCPSLSQSFATRAQEDTDIANAREWLAKLDHEGVEGFLKTHSQTSFSTSSGAGGQNVNRYVKRRLRRRH